MHPIHRETHLIQRIGWLRAAVLGANDGIISTASLMVGVARASTSAAKCSSPALRACAARCPWRPAEYVSVSSQADTENADLARERRELAEQPEAELDELRRSIGARGRARSGPAGRAADDGQDAFATHARDELGLSEHVAARPSGRTDLGDHFCGRSRLPLLVVIVSPVAGRARSLGGSLVGLAVLGALGARVGGAACSADRGSRSGARPRWRPPPHRRDLRACGLASGQVCPAEVCISPCLGSDPRSADHVVGSKYDVERSHMKVRCLSLRRNAVSFRKCATTGHFA